MRLDRLRVFHEVDEAVIAEVIGEGGGFLDGGGPKAAEEGGVLGGGAVFGDGGSGFGTDGGDGGIWRGESGSDGGGRGWRGEEFGADLSRF